jgi:trans-aconitate 2-methyltransferase
LFQEEAQEIIVFEKVYPHVLENADAVVDWISGTALVPYFERLDDKMRVEFIEAIRRRMRLELPSSPVFYPFKRILFSATRSK